MDVPNYSSTLSSAAKYLEKQAQTDIQLAQLMNKIRKNCIKSNYPKPDPKADPKAQAKRIVINFHSYNVYLSGCLIFEPVPYFHHGTVSFLDLPGDYNGLRPKFSLRNPDLSVLPFFPDQRGLA